jgi:hypothetical protein
MPSSLSPTLVERRSFYVAAVIALLLVLAGELLLSVRHLSQSFDEGAHLYAGLEHWKVRDFGVNPEHPPLVKLVAAAPILSMQLRPPHPPPILFFGEEYIGGNMLLYGNDADTLLQRGRTAVSVFTLALALLVFAAAYEMFGRTAALLALTLFTFEPTLLAHGALITTDMGVTCCMFAAVYAFYRYLNHPSAGRLMLCGLAAGLALAAKMSGFLVIPILLACALVDLFLESSRDAAGAVKRRRGQAVQAMSAVIVAALIGYGILWTFYSFRYAARPAGMAMTPTLMQFAHALPRQWETWVILHLAQWHLFPEAYLFGWTKLPIDQEAHPAFLLGRIFPTGTWMYFPVVLAIKSSLALLFFLLLAPFMYLRDLRSFRRPLMFALVPLVMILGSSMTSHLNIGVRHVLPMYPFAILIAAASAWGFAKSSRAAAYAVGAILLFNAISSIRAFPDYLPYSNEAFGGSSRSYRLLSDSNVDWGQQLKEVNVYLKQRNIRDCWMAYSFPGSAATYYGVPCKALPTGISLWTEQPQQIIPSTISGTLLISTTDSSGVIWGEGDANPYGRFQQGTPDGMIGHSILVYRGTYELPLAAAASHVSQIPTLVRAGKADAAVAEAQAAVNLAPGSAQMQARLGGALLSAHRPEEAEEAFREAMRKAQAHKSNDQTQEITMLIAGLRHPLF